MFAVLASFPNGCTASQLAARSGYSRRKSTWRGAIAELRKADLIAGGPDHFTLSDTGAAQAPPAEIPTGDELWSFWTARLGEGPKVFLTALRNAWPRDLTRDELADITGYDPAKSTWRGILATLRSFDLVAGSGPFALDADLAEALAL